MSSPYSTYLDFHLPDEFIDSYTDRPIKWGFPDAAGNSLGELTFLRSYSRLIDGRKERWHDVCRRVTEGTYHEQRKFCVEHRLPWNWKKATASAKEFYDRMFNFKWLPPGRGLWACGTRFVHENSNSAALQNCAFVSTSEMSKDHPEIPFAFLMEASMLGIGVGFDTDGAAKGFHIYQPKQEGTLVIEDSREGWVSAVSTVIRAFLTPKGVVPTFDYSAIRAAGSPINGFGGVSAGPQPLVRLVSVLSNLFEKSIGGVLTTKMIVDIMNMIGVCVVSGNVRRSAEIALGSADDQVFASLKDYKMFPERQEWGWMSNNSIRATPGLDYTNYSQSIVANGEPGFVYMDLIRSHGRLVDPANHKDHRAVGTNPCGEQSLESMEMCVTGDTLIHTPHGTYPIASVVGSSLPIWNGENWSLVAPFTTGDQDVYKVTLSDGSILRATAGHEWSVRSGRGYKKVRTDQLKEKDKLPEFTLGETYGRRNTRAYEWGWLTGDGYTDGKDVMLLVHEKEQQALEFLPGRVRPLYKGFYRIATDCMTLAEAQSLRNHQTGLPKVISEWDKKSIADFVGGWIDTDGSLIRNNETDHYVLYGSEQKLRDLQILLRRIGVDHSTLRMVSPEGIEVPLPGGRVCKRNYSLWRLLIPSYEASAVATKLKKAVRFGSRYKVNNRYPHTVIDAARKQKIVSVEYDGYEPTYCFTEGQRHMGVFGNAITHQCTLVETFPTNCKDKDDYLRTLKYSYLYAKTVTLIPTHFPQTNAVMQRNRRIGTSMSGLAQFVETRSRAELREWMNDGYKEIQTLDKDYSEWLGVRESIKTTSIKPSGSVSLLAGVTPGVHWPTESRYIRRIIVGANDVLAVAAKKSGYTVAPSTANPETSVVIEFPITGPDIRTEKEVSIFEKADLAELAQFHWADNQVSCTLTFDREAEGRFIPVVLRMFEDRLKSVSFLPMDSSTYPQMPYEAITEEQYKQMGKKLKPIDWDKLYTTAADAESEQGCTNDVCEIRH